MNRILRAKQILVTGVGVIALCAAFPIDIAGAAPANANLITLPSFEVPVVPHVSPAVIYPAGSHIGPWTVSYNAAAIGGEFPPIVNGIKGRNKQFLSLKDPTSLTAGSATVCQRVALDPAQRYRLRFYGAAVSLDATILVIWQRHIVARFAETGSIGDTAWLHHTVPLGPAPGAQFGELCFSSQGDGFAIVDAVNLQPTA